jgi:hypothetical protein
VKPTRSGAGRGARGHPSLRPPGGDLGLEGPVVAAELAGLQLLEGVDLDRGHLDPPAVLLERVEEVRDRAAQGALGLLARSDLVLQVLDALERVGRGGREVHLAEVDVGAARLLADVGLDVVEDVALQALAVGRTQELVELLRLGLDRDDHGRGAGHVELELAQLGRLLVDEPAGDGGAEQGPEDHGPGEGQGAERAQHG